MSGTAMEAFNFDLEVAADNGKPEAVRLAAIEGVKAKAFLSCIVILPTNGENELLADTRSIFEEHMDSLRAACEQLGNIVNEGEQPAVMAAALELKGFFDTFVEVAQVTAERSAELTLDRDGRDDEVDDGDLPTHGDPGRRGGVAIRGAFVPWPTHTVPAESCCCLPVTKNGCAIVVKDTRGLQLVWRYRLIGEWIEPWFARRRIIYRWVWVLEWTPVCVVKTITARCNGATSVQSRVFRDHRAMTLWGGYPPCTE